MPIKHFCLLAFLHSVGSKGPILVFPSFLRMKWEEKSVLSSSRCLEQTSRVFHMTHISCTCYVVCRAELNAHLRSIALISEHVKCMYHYEWMGRDSSVGIAIRYGLDGSGIESR
jgi:hypothetical protein